MTRQQAIDRLNDYLAEGCWDPTGFGHLTDAQLGKLQDLWHLSTGLQSERDAADDLMKRIRKLRRQLGSLERLHTSATRGLQAGVHQRAKLWAEALDSLCPAMPSTTKEGRR